MKKLLSLVFLLILSLSCGDSKVYNDEREDEKIEDNYRDVDIENISADYASLINQRVELDGNYKPYNDNSKNPPVAHALFFDTDSSAAIEVDLTFCNFYVFGDGQFLTLYGILKNNSSLGTYIEVYYLRNNSGPLTKVPFRDP